MSSKFKRALLSPIPYLFSNNTRRFLIKRWSKGLTNQISGKVTDKFLELLLKGMDLAFYLSKGYRKNIKDFSARYVFRTSDHLVGVTTDFRDGDMRIHEEANDDWNARITFKSAAALRSFIFSKDQDILNSLLKNEVEVDGNLNYIYKFGFMARDLAYKLGVQ